MAEAESTTTKEAGTEGRDGKRFYENSGQAKKQCPSCGKYVAAPHKGLCPNEACSHVHVAKDKTDKTPAKSRTTSTTVPQVLLLLRDLKKLRDTKENWEEVREEITSIALLIERAGGKAELLDTIKYLEDENEPEEDEPEEDELEPIKPKPTTKKKKK